jgi:TldD protein
MKNFAKKVLENLPLKGIDYADIRITNTKNQVISTKNGTVESVTDSTDEGFGIRVLINGAWGFAASSKLETTEIKKVISRATEIAKASALSNGDPVVLSALKKQKGSYRTKFSVDPFKVPLEQKISLLLEADTIMCKNPSIKVARGSLWFMKEDKVFASTDGSFIDQHILESGAEINALAVDGPEVQVRSYPNLGGDTSQAGYEFIQKLDLAGNAELTAREASLLLKAANCPTGSNTIIISTNHLALQVHESIGHPIELDRVFGMEAAYAGTSFLTTEKLNTLKYGSEIVNVNADATVPGGLGTFGWDDEGVPAQKVPIIKNGLFTGYLSSRETASILGLSSGGAMRADKWNRIPLIRMTNINLEPGKWEFDDLIADTTDGLYFDTTKTWSIDDKRLNFLFATELAREIKDGRFTGKIFKNATYTGMTPEFWNSCDAICSRKHWRLWGVPNCGKGQPGQGAHVGHGVSPARFRNVMTGVSH